MGFKGLDTSQTLVPKLVHFMMLGGVDKEGYMFKTAEWNKDFFEKRGFEVKFWFDKDAEDLVEEFHNDGLKKAWEYIKQDNGFGKFAKRADFIRPLIIYAMGGTYLDTDMIACGGIDYMVDTPGVASFPWKLEVGGNQVSGAAMSAPPGHRLMGLAMESFIGKGDKLRTEANLWAAGNVAFANATDYYFKELGIDLPPIYKKFNPYNAKGTEDGKIKKNVEAPASKWPVQIGDVRFAFYGAFPYKKLFHIAFRTWHDGYKPRCEKLGKHVKPWLDEFCPDAHFPNTPYACGPEYKKEA